MRLQEQAALLVRLLLQEAVLLNPPPQWPRKRHIMERLYRKEVNAEDRVQIMAMILNLTNGGIPIMVPEQKWWMPFPLGYRLAGEGANGVTIIGPSQTLANVRVDNPYLSEVDKTWWR